MMEQYDVALTKSEMQMVMLALQMALVGLDQKFGAAVAQVQESAPLADSSHKE